MHFHIVTLFPEAFESYCASSILGRAKQDKKIKISFYNPRTFTKDKHRRVDQRPYGGGPGMVLEAEPILQAVQEAVGRKRNVRIVFFSPSGQQFTEKHAEYTAQHARHVVLIAGHYEGVDARVAKALKAEKISIGPYVLTGGELPAMVFVDAVARFVPGVLGSKDSLEDTRASSPEVYTRPESFHFKGKKYIVPKVLLSGHHKAIQKWRAKKRGGRDR